MILDESTLFANSKALSGLSLGTSLFGNVIDLSWPFLTSGHSIGQVPLWLTISVPIAAASGGLATAQFALVSDSAAAIATDGSATLHWQGGAIPVAAMAAGYQAVSIMLPPGPYERYLGLLITVGTAVFTAGKIDAALTPASHDWKAYAAASH